MWVLIRGEQRVGVFGVSWLGELENGNNSSTQEIQKKGTESSSFWSLL